MENRKIAIGAVRVCKTRAELDNTLDLFKITGIQETIDFLNECMYNPQTFSTPGEISPEDDLEFTIQIFLTGGWRLYEKYNRLGIGVVNTNV